jgi:predicted nucleic acid-binding protein
VFLVDTNVFIDAFDGHEPALEWLRDNHSKILIPSVVVLELFQPQGITNRERRDMWKVLERYSFANPNDSDWSRARTAQREWDQKNPRPDPGDTIIAVTASGLGFSVATRNTKHFEHLCDCFQPYEDP